MNAPLFSLHALELLLLNNAGTSAATPWLTEKQTKNSPVSVTFGKNMKWLMLRPISYLSFFSYSQPWALPQTSLTNSHVCCYSAVRIKCILASIKFDIVQSDTTKSLTIFDIAQCMSAYMKNTLTFSSRVEIACRQRFIITAASDLSLNAALESCHVKWLHFTFHQKVNAVKQCILGSEQSS